MSTEPRPCRNPEVLPKAHPFDDTHQDRPDGIFPLLSRSDHVIPSYEAAMSPPPWTKPRAGRATWRLADQQLPPGLRNGSARNVTLLLSPFGTSSLPRSKKPGHRRRVPESQIREAVALGRHLPPDVFPEVEGTVSAAIFFAFLDARYGVTDLDYRRAWEATAAHGR